MEELTVAEFEERLNAATERREQETLKIEARNQELEELITQKEELLVQIENAWKQFQDQRRHIDREISRLLTPTSATVATEPAGVR